MVAWPVVSLKVALGGPVDSVGLQPYSSLESVSTSLSTDCPIHFCWQPVTTFVSLAKNFIQLLPAPRQGVLVLAHM
jgi:hypothetical protein